jgi:hypothetical protein
MPITDIQRTSLFDLMEIFDAFPPPSEGSCQISIQQLPSGHQPEQYGTQVTEWQFATHAFAAAMQAL